MAFASKSPSNGKQRYSNIEWEVLYILHSLEEFYHYCFAREESIIMDQKPLVTIFKKDVKTLSQGLQHILLRIHQCRVHIIYKLGSDLFIADWLWRQNHVHNKDKEIRGLKLSIDAIRVLTEILTCMAICSIQDSVQRYDHLQKL